MVEDYKVRFIKEYEELLERQLAILNDYLKVLLERAKLENVKL